MRIEKLSLRGLLRFTDTVSLDLRDLPPGLIAITGENGAGKSALLEASLATLYRRFLSRDGELYDYAGDRRDSFMEVEIATDGRGAYRARVNIDGLRRTSDAILEVVQPDGSRVLLNDGKASTFDAAIAQHFPPRPLLLASAFAAQNKAGSFVTLEKKARKQLFATLLGLEHYQAMSDTARQAAAFVDQARGRLQAVQSELTRETDDRLVMELDRLAHELQTTGGNAEVRQRALVASIVQLEARLATVADTVAAHASATMRLRTLQEQIAARQAEQCRIRDVEHPAAVKALGAELERLTRDRDAQLLDLGNRIASNEVVLDKAADIRAAVAAIAGVDQQLPTLRARLEEEQADVEAVGRTDAEVARQEAAAATATGQLDRARRDAALLAGVPCGGAGAYAACQFLTNAAAAKDQIAGLEVQALPLAALSASRQALASRYQTAKGTAVATQQEIRTLNTTRADHDRTAQYAEALAAAEARIAELKQARTACTEHFEQAEHLARERQADRLQVFTDRGGRIEEAICALIQERQSAEADLAASATGNAQALTLLADLSTARADRDGVIATLARVDAGRQELQRRREELKAKLARLTAIVGRDEQLVTELLEWQTLTRAFGRDGLPVLEIDAAGPTISAYTNELLQVCFGARFSVELVTQREKADGKGFTDDFSIRVFDNERGGDPRDIADLSGGEQVIVSEALRNAIALYVNTRLPMSVQTAWRDETVGALDVANGLRYVQMLRKVHELGRYHHIFFISHNPELSNLADAQIRIANGKAVIVYPPYTEEIAA